MAAMRGSRVWTRWDAKVAIERCAADDLEDYGGSKTRKYLASGYSPQLSDSAESVVWLWRADLLEITKALPEVFVIILPTTRT
jgi:hypothetical protein